MPEKNETVQINLTKVHLIFATIILIISLLTPVVAGFVTINKNTEDIGLHHARILILELDKTDNHDLLLELKFNLKSHMKTAGETYIDMEGKK